jgi:hypothetical protein
VLSFLSPSKKLHKHIVYVLLIIIRLLSLQESHSADNLLFMNSMKASSSSNSVLDEARKRAESRASILNSLSASFKDKSNENKHKRPRENVQSSNDTKHHDSKKRKVPEASSSSQSSSVNIHNKAMQASVVQAKDTNNKSIELVMSFVESMNASIEKDGAREAIEVNANLSGELPTGSSRPGFASIKFRNRLHEYLQEQLPSKALLLDNGSAQLDAIQRSRGQSSRNQPTYANVSNRELMELHGSTNKKRRKVWEAEIRSRKMTLSTLQQMHDQWILYTYRAFLSKGVDEQALQTRLFNGLELVGAYVQAYRNTTYTSSRYRSSAIAPRCKNDRWEDGLFGYVVDVSPSCYYVVRCVDSRSSTSETTSVPTQPLPLEVLCIHKVACNLAVFLPTAATEKEARARISEMATKTVSDEAEDEEDHSLASGNDDNEGEIGGVGSTLPLAIAEGVDADVSMNMDEGTGTDRPSTTFQNNNPIFIVFGRYFDRNQRTRQQEFPYSVLPSSSAL